MKDIELVDVVLYLRYSSSSQSEQSIEGQDRICRSFCKASGMNVVDVYIDRAVSASKDAEKRYEFQRMIRDSDKRLWQNVVVYKLDRFARNRYDSATYKAKLKRNGVRVVSATENISDNPEGIILEAVLEGMAEFYSKELAQKINRGMYETAKKCNSCGGQGCLGYKIENKKLVLDPHGATIVQKAFEMYANGHSVVDICNHFNDLGYKTKKGVAFNKSSFNSMFKNEKYLGVYKYKDIRVEGGVPAIVDEETFNKVQTRLEENSTQTGSGKALVDYLLSGKLFCGHCESRMNGAAATSHTGKKHYYYTCAGRKTKHNCNKANIRKELIERVVVEDTVKLLTPELIEQIADIAVRASEREIKENTLLPSLEAQSKDVERSIKNLLKMVESGADSHSLAERLNELENEKRAVEKQLLRERSEKTTLNKSQIIFWLNQFLDGDINDPDFQRNVIDLLVNSVYVTDDDTDGNETLIISYNLTPGKTSKVKLNELKGFGYDTQSSTIASLSEPFLVNMKVFAIVRKHCLSFVRHI